MRSKMKNWKKVFLRFLRSDITKIVLAVIFVVCAISLNISFLLKQNFSPETYFININDVDRLADGTTVVQVSKLQTAFIANQGKEQEFEATSGILELDQNGNIIWEFTPNGIDHHVDHEIVAYEDGYFFCDSFKDAIKYINKSSMEVEWEYKLEDINWTEVNSSWGPDHYYNMPCNQWNMIQCIDWSHLNDIDFKNYGSWEAMLVSIRNFDLIIEVNYTAARQRINATAEDITWYYTGKMHHQHNPDYLPNGNLIIVDSDNQKFIEVNMSTKEIVWEWTDSSIRWPRDCDLIPNDCYLITDIDRALIMNRTSGEILIEFGKIFGGYEADYITSSNTVIVSSGSSGVIIEYDANTGEIVWKWGTDVLKQIAFSNCIFLIIYESLWIFLGIFMESKNRFFLIIPLLLLIGLEVYILVDYHNLTASLFEFAING
jgi:outer membrane protein assembly factor BamB